MTDTINYKKFIFASHNPHKLEEVQRILLPLHIQVIDSKTAQLPDVEETGTTFAENAILKAVAGFKKTGLPVLADDSGLCISALNDAPGVFSARFAAKYGGYPAVFDVLNQKLKDNPNRKAHYVCIMALALSESEIYTFEGQLQGQLALTPQGINGFGYDPIFIPDGYDETLGCISATEKNKISHRAKALQKLFDFLKNHSF